MAAAGSETAEERESGRCGLGDGRGEGEWALRTWRRSRRGGVGAAGSETADIDTGHRYDKSRYTSDGWDVAGDGIWLRRIYINTKR